MGYRFPSSAFLRDFRLWLQLMQDQEEKLGYLLSKV
jgi:hypothetical protein